MPIPPVYMAEQERLVGELTAGLGPDAVALLWSEGRDLPAGAALELALRVPADSSARV